MPGPPEPLGQAPPLPGRQFIDLKMAIAECLESRGRGDTGQGSLPSTCGKVCRDDNTTGTEPLDDLRGTIATKDDPNKHNSPDDTECEQLWNVHGPTVPCKRQRGEAMSRQAPALQAAPTVAPGLSIRPPVSRAENVSCALRQELASSFALARGPHRG